ncbi:MAG: DMT family transporter [Pseudomonadota bacterium]
MSTALSTHEIDRDAMKGMALMVAATFVMPTLDAVAKILGETFSPGQIALMRFGIQTLVLAIVFLVLGRPIFGAAVRKALPKLALAGMFMAVATLTFFWSLQHLPLANAIVLIFVAPLFLTLYGKLFLGETVGPHRIGAVAVGFVGALIVIRPNFLMFGFAAVLPLIAAAGFAALMATVRSIRFAVDGFSTQLVSGGFAMMFLSAAILIDMPFGVAPLGVMVPPVEVLPLIALLGALGIIGQAMLTFASRLAEASLIAPFQYLEIVAATFLGYVIFSEFPDRLTWVGAAIILSAGLYTLHRERVRRRARRAGVARA